MSSNKQHFLYLGKVSLFSVILACPSLISPSGFSLFLGLIGGLFFLLATGISTIIALSSPYRTSKAIIVGFGSRFLIIALYSYLLFSHLQLDVIAFGIGLFLPFISLYLYEAYLFWLHHQQNKK